MHVFRTLEGLTLTFALCLPLHGLSQQNPPDSEVTSEHLWLKRFEGSWSSKSRSNAPGQPVMECMGKMESRRLGDLWVVNELSGEVGGTKMKGLQTIGFDATRKKYVGIWVDSVMNHMWRYEGTVDASGKKLLLEAKGPSFTEPGKELLYRDSYEFKTPDWIVSTSEVQNPDGTWTLFMSGDLHRNP